MKAKMAYKVIDLLKEGRKYKDGVASLFLELSYEAPYFIRYEYHGDGFNGEAYSHRTQLTEKELFDFITR